MRRWAISALLVLSPELARAADVVLVVIDDLGVDSLGVYDEVSACASSGLGCATDADCHGGDACVTDYPLTPNIDQLAAEGVVFRNAWSAPFCTPSRAMLMTGRHGFRTSVLSNGMDLPPAELTLPEVLADPELGPAGTLNVGAFGKWHLGGGASGPNDQGFPHFAGSLGNLGSMGVLGNYFSWPRTVNGVTTTCSGGSSACHVTAYATSVAVNDALSWLGHHQGPFFMYLSFNAGHAPMHVPPHHLLSPQTLAALPQAAPGQPEAAGYVCEGSEKRACYLAALEALDRELGRVLDALPRTATVIVVGDNGTPREVTPAPLEPQHGKGSLYEGGINVPLIIRDAERTSAGSVSDAMVQTVDVFATVLDLLGAVPPRDRPIDGISLMPLVLDPSGPGHPLVHSELELSKANRDQRFKLIHHPTHDELFDLGGDPPLVPADPLEENDLLLGHCALTTSVPCHSEVDCASSQFCILPPLSSVSAMAHAQLTSSMERLVVQPAGAIAAGSLRLDRLANGVLRMTWDDGCHPGDQDFAVYEGSLGNFNSHVLRTCTTLGLATHDLSRSFGDRYYLVVPQNGWREGSYGRDSSGNERSAAMNPCLTQDVAPSCD